MLYCCKTHYTFPSIFEQFKLCKRDYFEGGKKKKLTKCIKLLLLRGFGEVMVNSFVSNLLLSTLRVGLFMGEIIEGEKKGETRVLGWGEKYGWSSFRENKRENGKGESLVGEGRKWGRRSFLPRPTI